ncbi:MAG: flagellar type III secretion system pore protein FliP [Myxococcota bacterium]
MVGQTLSALAVVLGALVALRVVLGWLRPGSGRGGRMRVVETCALGQRQRLHIVEVDGESLLVGASEGELRLLRRLAGAAPASDDAAARASAAEAHADARVASVTPLARPLRAWLRAATGALVVALAVAALAEPAAAQAASEGPLLGIDLGGATAPGRIATTLEILALVTLVSVAPSILLMGTCFTRIVIVLSLLRQAIGVNQLPPSQVLVGLSLFLTAYAMSPVGSAIESRALTPYVEGRIEAAEALVQAQEPVRDFMLRHTREADLAMFAELSGGAPIASPDEVPLSTLLPSYMISELRTAFEIGFMLFLPFLVIDLVIASMLISMGMIVLPPVVISFPFKIMLFVLLDGWHLLVRSLMSGIV